LVLIENLISYWPLLVKQEPPQNSRDYGNQADQYQLTWKGLERILKGC